MLNNSTPLQLDQNLSSFLHKDQDEDEDEDILFVNEDEIELQEESSDLSSKEEGWKVIILDDEPAVHEATQLALRNFVFEGKSLNFLSAYSGDEGRKLVEENHLDTAFILIDVVMETQDAGLKVVHFIRNELHNKKIRIILRTGQPGEAPEESVILDYDINDYKLKVELTRQRLLTTVIMALRSYRDIMTIERQKIELSRAFADLELLQKKLKDYSYNLEMAVSKRTAELQKVNQSLHRLVLLDGLTLVSNRRHFDEYLSQQWNIFAQIQQPLSLILVDVDNFKSYNDYYGHLAGDDCLKQVAQVMNRVLRRPTDLAARYGGEEFAVVLPSTPIEGAIQVAEVMMREIQALDLPHVRSSTGDCVTVSLGISCMVPQIEFSLETLIATADKALYQAKRNGRNGYCVYVEEV